MGATDNGCSETLSVRACKGRQYPALVHTDKNEAVLSVPPDKTSTHPPPVGATDNGCFDGFQPNEVTAQPGGTTDQVAHRL